MNILCLTPAYRPASANVPVGGGELSNRMLLEGLAKRGHSISVVAVNGGGVDVCEANGVQIHQSRIGSDKHPMRVVYAYLRYRVVAEEVARRASPHVVLAATSALPVAQEIARSNGLACGLFVRAFEHFRYGDAVANRLRPWAVGQLKAAIMGSSGVRALKRCDFLLPNSNYMKEVCGWYAPDIRSHVVYPPLLFAGSRQVRDVDKKPLKIVMVGTGANKGTDTVIALAKCMPDVEFKIIGVPGFNSVEVSNNNLTRLGWCDVRSQFRKADLVIAPSLCNEAFGRVAVEALIEGSLVLVSDKGGLPEAVGYESSLVVSPHDQVAAWERKIRDVIENSPFYVEACQRAQDRIGKFSLDNQIDILEKTLVMESSLPR